VLWHDPPVLRPARPLMTLALILGLLVVAAAPTLAHMVRFPRLVHVKVEPERLRLGLIVRDHTGLAAGTMRSRFDHDGDGRLDAAERESLAVWLEASSSATIELKLDGVVLLPEPVERRLELDVDDRTEAGDGYQFRSAADLGVVLLPGEHTLVIADRPESVRGMIPFRIDLPAGWELLESSAVGEASPLLSAGEQTWQTAFAGEGGAVTLRVRVPAREQVEQPGAGAEVEGTLGSEPR
jgi:hypothetical protein